MSGPLPALPLVVAVAGMAADDLSHQVQFDSDGVEKVAQSGQRFVRAARLVGPPR